MNEVKKCYSCGREMHFAQRIPFRIKGTPGLYKLVIGEWAELGEDLLNFDVYVCPSCGEIRFSADEQTKRSLLGKAFLKKCVKCGKEIPIASEECQYCGAKQKNEGVKP
jgi:DNA-directed RNA polymerase subunit RPC12/RpoP